MMHTLNTNNLVSALSKNKPDQLFTERSSFRTENIKIIIIE